MSLLEKLRLTVGYVVGQYGPTGFGSASTAEQVADKYPDQVNGRVFLVTGGTGGLGKETARVLASRGGRVYITARDKAKGDLTVADIKKQHPSAVVSVVVMDLESLESVRKGVKFFLDLNVPLHVLINNAGVMATPRLKTKDGFEFQFGINHLAHFFLTELLLPKLKASAPSRVVNVSSLAQYLYSSKQYFSGTPIVGIKFDDINSEKVYDAVDNYGHSKLANVLHANELTKRYSSAKITAYSLHPGSIADTDLSRYLLGENLYQKLAFLKPIVATLLMFKSVGQGAATQVYCAIAPEAVPGYYADVNLDREFVHPKAFDEVEAERLYDLSLQLVGLKKK